MHATLPALERLPARDLPARRVLRNWLARAGAWVDAHPALAFTLLLLIYLPAELSYSLRAPLWHDELFTFYIAQAPSTRTMLEWTRRVDLNPPLSYLLTRLCFHLFGVGTLQTRLPEFTGFAFALYGIFTFVRRRAGAAFGLLAASLLFGSRAGDLIFQARPYGLMLGTSALALAFWQSSSSSAPRPGRASNLRLFIALCALLLTHVLGLLFWLSLAVAETVQCVRRHRSDLGRALAILLPLTVTTAYGPLLQNHAACAFPSAFQPTGATIFAFYIGHIDRELVSLLLSALSVVLVAGRSWLRGKPVFLLTEPEWFAISGCLLAPLLLLAHLMRQHGAFFDRYGVIACLGVSVLCSVLFHAWTGGRAGAAVVASVLALLVTCRLPDAATAVLHTSIFRHTEPRVHPLDTAAMRDPQLPLVVSSGLTFLEMQRREPPSLLNRTVFLTDPTAALRYAHATIFDGLPAELQLFGLHRTILPYAPFLSGHPRFYVLGTYNYPEDWLLRKLQADGAQIILLGHVADSYKDTELYEVRAPASLASP